MAYAAIIFADFFVARRSNDAIIQHSSLLELDKSDSH
jgi:hypothetical protein